MITATEIEEQRAVLAAAEQALTRDADVADYEAAAASQRRAALAGGERGQAMLAAQRELRRLEALQKRQNALKARRQATEQAMAARLKEMDAELVASRARLQKACASAPLATVGREAQAHDQLVRRTAAELREAGLLIDEAELHFNTGAIEDGRNTGLLLDSKWWLSCDAKKVTLWVVCHQMAATFGADDLLVQQLRYQHELRQMSPRADGLLDGVKVPAPAASQQPAPARMATVPNGFGPGSELQPASAAEAPIVGRRIRSFMDNIRGDN